MKVSVENVIKWDKVQWWTEQAPAQCEVEVQPVGSVWLWKHELARRADTEALQSSPCVLSWPMLTTLMECIKRSTDIIDRTVQFYSLGGGDKKPGFSNLLNDKEQSHKRTGIIHTQARSSGVLYYVNDLFLFIPRHFDEGLYRWLIR